MSTILPSVAILGTGNMGGAILRGLLAPGIEAESIRVTTRSAASAHTLRASGVEAKSLEEDSDANAWALETARLVVLGVKPYQIVELLGEISSQAHPDAVMVSVAAGITIPTMEKVWPGALVRAMPNTPSGVGKGVTGMSIGTTVSPDQSREVETLFGTVGEVLVIAEEQINALSSLSGSGPAYVYFFMEKFLEVAGELGFSPDQAEVMIRGTFVGALALLEQSGQAPHELREAVTSPQGTTEAALNVYAAADLPSIILQASAAAIARAQELAGD